jgi:hypothetical protein
MVDKAGPAEKLVVKGGPVLNGIVMELLEGLLDSASQYTATTAGIISLTRNSRLMLLMNANIWVSMGASCSHSFRGIF